MVILTLSKLLQIRHQPHKLRNAFTLRSHCEHLIDKIAQNEAYIFCGLHKII